MSNKSIVHTPLIIIFPEDDKGKLYLEKCPECKLENYTLNVATGICAWCGYEANEKKEVNDEC